MSYDRDIRRGRQIAWLLMLANLGAAVLNARAHNWPVAFACLIWVWNSYLVLSHAAFLQVTRDMGRVIEAGLDAMRREMEDH